MVSVVKDMKSRQSDSISLQIWDFNLGRSRNHEETAALEVGYNDAGFMMKNYRELIKENSLATTKVLEDIYDMNCSSVPDDISSTDARNMSSQNVRTFKFILHVTSDFSCRHIFTAR